MQEFYFIEHLYNYPEDEHVIEIIDVSDLGGQETI